MYFASPAVELGQRLLRLDGKYRGRVLDDLRVCVAEESLQKGQAGTEHVLDHFVRRLGLGARSMKAPTLALGMRPLREGDDPADGIQRTENRLVVPSEPLRKVDVEVRTSIRRVLGSERRKRATP